MSARVVDAVGIGLALSGLLWSGAYIVATAPRVGAYGHAERMGLLGSFGKPSEMGAVLCSRHPEHACTVEWLDEIGAERESNILRAEIRLSQPDLYADEWCSPDC